MIKIKIAAVLVSTHKNLWFDQILKSMKKFHNNFPSVNWVAKNAVNCIGMLT